MRQDRLGKLRGRRIEPISALGLMGEAYERLTEESAIKYALGAMQPIDPAYTKKRLKRGTGLRRNWKKSCLTTTLGQVFDIKGL